MNEFPSNSQDSNQGRLAHILYLTNITFLPVISFLLLLFLYQKIDKTNSKFVVSHFRQSITANIAAGILLIIVSGLILYFGSFDSVYTWMWLILYVTCVHSILILFGVFAMMRASNNKEYCYPIFGKIWR